MPDITVASGIIDHYNGPESTLLLRIYANSTFTLPEGEVIVRSSFGEDFYRQIVCTTGTPCDDNTNDGVAYPSFSIDPTSTGTPNTGSYKLVLCKPNGDFLKVVFEALKVPDSPTTTTLPALNEYTEGLKLTTCATPQGDSLVTWSQLQAVLDTLGSSASPATQLALGLTRMSADPEEMGIPVAMEKYDPKMRGLTKSYFMEEFADLPAAVSAVTAALAGSLGELVFTCPTTYAATATTLVIPGNITCRFKASGKITVSDAGSKVVCYVEAPATKRIFAGAGKVLVPFQETHLEWWVDPTTNIDNTHAVQQAVDSTTYNGVKGGIIHAGPIDVFCKDVVLHSSTTLRGIGSSVNMPTGSSREGTCFRLAAGGATIFKIHPDTNDNFPKFIRVEKCGFTTGTVTDANANCIYIGGLQGTDGTSYNVEFEQCGFQAEGAGQTAFRVKGNESAPTSSWEIIGLSIKGCYFQHNGMGIHFFSSNSTVMMERCTFQAQPTSNTVDIFAEQVGEFTGINLDHRASPGGMYSSEYDPTPYKTLTSVTLSACDHWPDPDHIHSKMVINSGPTLDSNDIARALVFPSGFVAYITKILGPNLALLSWHPENPTGTINFSGYTGVSPTMHQWLEQPNIAGTCFKTYGNFNLVNLINSSDEGYNRSVDVGNGAWGNGKMNIIGSVLQGKIVPSATVKIHLVNSRCLSLAIDDQTGTGDAIITIRDSTFFRGSVIPNVYTDQGEAFLYTKPTLRAEGWYTAEYIDNFAQGANLPAYGEKRVHLQAAPWRQRSSEYEFSRAGTGPTSMTRQPKHSICQNLTEFNTGTDPTMDRIVYETGLYAASSGLQNVDEVPPDFWYHRGISWYGRWFLRSNWDLPYRGFDCEVPLHLLEGADLPAGQSLTAEGTIISSSSILVNSKADNARGIGYAAGAGVSVAQATNRNTAVTANAMCGLIQTTSEALAAGATAIFKINNTCFKAGDMLIILSEYGGTPLPSCQAFTTYAQDNSFYIYYKNPTGGNETNPYFIYFTIIKGVTS